MMHAMHIAVLAEIACYVSNHICPIDLKPDLVIWNVAKRTVFLIELTCPFEENFVHVAIRKD